MFIAWEDSYKLGIPNIDSDHHLLVDLLNRFFERAEAGEETRQLGQILAELIETTRAHFAREELMLDRNDYPGLATHAAEHRRLLQQMQHFQGPFAEGWASRALTIEHAEFLRHWLLDHIEREDRPYKPYVMKLS
jgi:hemerythrin